MKVGTKAQVWDKESAINFVADAFLKAHPTNTAKRVANDLGAPYKTVEKWTKRDNAPQLHQFLNAVQRIPELKAAMRELLDMGETNPRFARALHDLLRAAQESRP